jgi:hypothetical protein
MNVFYPYEEIDILKIAQTEHRLHPKSELTDYYKLFFQAYYGQGHFIPDFNKAESYLINEIKEMRGPYQPLLQDISNKRGLFRVSLSVISKKLLHQDDFWKLFIRGSKNAAKLDDWPDIWSYVFRLIDFDISYSKNQVRIKELVKISKSRKLISHSEVFRLTYQPHYRVMLITEQEMLNYPELRKQL